MDIETSLINRYGHLLTLAEVAEILKRSPDGLRVSLGRNNEVSKKLNMGKKKIGRRVYFRVAAIAELIES
ncbi:DNA-binding protein [Sedimenticola hydrogenitrophicus]|uniref:DNA-binding protein n=1 Tax=Sedimenticola hydrogenitrophicus TaxID=2967975 RepID=UPI0021A973DE|nr:DNA-binding protein [Sedimenticola hydrogenitrophicus]